VFSCRFNNVPKFHLPENSLYAPIEHQIDIRAKGQQSVQWGSAADYAAEVVKDVLSGKQGRVYRGVTAGLVRWVVGWAPQWLLVSIKAFLYLEE
jgi:1-acylglycerone phosphate reductase